jgi:hypothetical protein
MHTQALGFRDGFTTRFASGLRHDEASRELHLLDVSLLAWLQISECQVGDFQHSGSIMRGSLKLSRRRVVGLRHAGAEFGREEKLPALLRSVHVSDVRPGVGLVPEMPAFNINRIRPMPRRGEISKATLLAVRNINCPALIYREQLKYEPAKWSRERLPLLDHTAERVGPSSAVPQPSPTRRLWRWMRNLGWTSRRQYR